MEPFAAFAHKFDVQLSEFLVPGTDVPAGLAEAVRYSALAPGKRIRPYLVVRCCELVGGDAADAMPVAAAMECVHAFSLIHDDLPAMDDDDERRGQPTCHKKFGEATAILAGDALVFLAFDLVTRHVRDAPLSVALVKELAAAAGWAGMIGGQMSDLVSEGRTPDRALVESIHRQKTARLMEASCRMGGLVGRGDTESVQALATFGSELGQAFQIADDLLDVDAEGVLAVAEGARRGSKQTLPHSVGIEESRRIARQSIASAVGYLSRFGEDAADLRSLADFVVDRNY